MKNNINTEKNISIEESMEAFAEYCNSYKGDCSGCSCSHFDSKSMCYMFFIKNVYGINFFEKTSLKRTI